VRVPEQAKTGIAIVTVSVPGWQGVTFASKTFEIGVED
jgi:hypothetical protein